MVMDRLIIIVISCASRAVFGKPVFGQINFGQIKRGEANFGEGIFVTGVFGKGIWQCGGLAKIWDGASDRY